MTNKQIRSVRKAGQSSGPSRRTVVKGAAALGAVAAVGAPAIVRAQSGGRVLVRTSGGSFQEALQAGTWNAFTELTGIEVVPVPANTAKLLAMVEADATQLDLVEANGIAILTLEEKGALEPLDTSKFEFTDPADLGVVTEHYTGYLIFAEALAYNTDAFPDRHPMSWAEFWDVEAFPGPRMLQDAKAIAPNLEFALLADGVAVADLYPIDVDRAFAKLAEIKPNIVKWHDSGALGASIMAEGTAVLGSLWTNRVIVLKKDGAPLDVEWNQAMRMHEYSAILKNAPNRDNALRLLDFASSPEAQAKTLPVIGLSPFNVKAYELIDPAVAATLPFSPENRPIGFDNNSGWWLENRAEIAERWQEFLLS